MNEQCIRREAVRCACMRLHLLFAVVVFVVVSEIYAHCIYIERHTHFSRDGYIFGVLTLTHAYLGMQHILSRLHEYRCVHVYIFNT